MDFPNFPLYYTLKNNKIILISDKEKDHLIEKIKNMKEQEHEIIYALICAYYLENNGGIESFPYHGKNLKMGLKMDLDNIPPEAQGILLKFVNLEK